METHKGQAIWKQSSLRNATACCRQKPQNSEVLSKGDRPLACLSLYHRSWPQRPSCPHTRGLIQHWWILDRCWMALMHMYDSISAPMYHNYNLSAKNVSDWWRILWLHILNSSRKWRSHCWILVHLLQQSWSRSFQDHEGPLFLQTGILKQSQTLIFISTKADVPPIKQDELVWLTESSILITLVNITSLRTTFFPSLLISQGLWWSKKPKRNRKVYQCIHCGQPGVLSDDFVKLCCNTSIVLENPLLLVYPSHIQCYNCVW